MLNIDYTPGAEKARLASAQKLSQQFGSDLGRFKFLEIQLAIRELSATPETCVIFAKDPYGVDIRYIIAHSYVIFYQIFDTHLYALDLMEEDERLEL